MIRATRFLASMAKNTTISTALDSGRSQQIVENRQRLRLIVLTVILCGTQNIPLRGHRDDGALTTVSENEAGSVVNEGNFRALLQFPVDGGDSVQQNHLQNTGKNATYISNKTQNEI